MYKKKSKDQNVFRIRNVFFLLVKKGINNIKTSSLITYNMIKRLQIY